MIFNRTVVDSHMHMKIFNDENNVDFIEFFDRTQQSHGLKGLNICATSFYNGIANNILCAIYKMHNPTAYAYGGLYYPSFPVSYPLEEGFDYSTQYEEMMEIGFDGIKSIELKPNIQKKYGFKLTDPEYDEFFKKCEENGTHMIWHVGDPETFWDRERISPRHFAKGWFYGDGSFMPLEEIYKQVDTILERHPKLKVTFAHFFFLSFSPERLVEYFEKYENVGVDITPGAEMYGAFRDNREFYREFFIKYADRIMFGTDTIFGGSKTNYQRLDKVYNFITSNETFVMSEEECRGMSFPDEVADKILYKNFEKLAGESPKPINKEALKRYVKKYDKYLEEGKVRDFIYDYLK